MKIRLTDSETASLQGGIVEIGSIEIDKDGKILSTYETLVNPEREIELDAMVIHNITNEMVSEAPTFAQVKGNIIDADISIAHNAAFDSRVLDMKDHKWWCTLGASRLVYPESKSHKNMYLFYSLGLHNNLSFDGTPHRALFDCHVTLELVRDMMRKMDMDLLELMSYVEDMAGEKICQYKKYKGLPWKIVLETDEGYCRWCVENSLKKGHEQAVREWLVKRLS